jgi:hypothetical protein
MAYLPWWASQRFSPGEDDGLSILDLVNSGTVDCKLAALLWVIMENRASVIVSSAPVYAGKTTLLHAILDFLPQDQNLIALRGYFEDFKFTELVKPEKSYLLAEEISNHGYAEYLWGAKAIRTFRLLAQGYSLGSTMHARNSEETIYILNGMLGISMLLLSRLGIIVNLRATNGRTEEDDPIRRVVSIDLILPDEKGLAIQVLAARQFTEKGFEYQDGITLQKSLASKNLIKKGSIYSEIEVRKHFLKHLMDTGKTTRGEVREAVQGYYRGKAEPKQNG